MFPWLRPTFAGSAQPSPRPAQVNYYVPEYTNWAAIASYLKFWDPYILKEQALVLKQFSGRKWIFVPGHHQRLW